MDIGKRRSFKAELKEKAEQQLAVTQGEQTRSVDNNLVMFSCDV